MLYKGRAYNRRMYGDITKTAIVLIVSMFIGYYGFVGVKCIKHYQSLMNNRVETINFFK